MSHRTETPASPVLRPTRRAVVTLLASAAAPLPVRAADDLVIGQVAPFSGTQALTGRAIHAGAKLCFDAVNARGGVRGRRIRLVTRDDAQKPENTVRLARELVAAEAPLALIGTVGTSNLEALARDGLLPRTRLAMMGAVSGAASVIAAPGMMVVKASYREEVQRLFKQLAGFGLARVGLVYQDDGLGQDVLVDAQAASAASGVALVARAGYARNTTQVDAAVAAMLASPAQAIFLGATTAAGIEFVRQYRQAGGTATLYGMSIIDTDALLKAVGPELARGYAFSVVLPLWRQTNLALVRDFLQARQAAPDPALTVRSMEGYVAARALVRTLEGLAAPAAAGVTAALQSARAVDLGGYVLDFGTPGRPGSRYVDFAMFGAGGKVVQ